MDNISYKIDGYAYPADADFSDVVDENGVLLSTLGYRELKDLLKDTSLSKTHKEVKRIIAEKFPESIVIKDGEDPTPVSYGFKIHDNSGTVPEAFCLMHRKIEVPVDSADTYNQE